MGDIKREQARWAADAGLGEALQTTILNLRQNRNEKRQGQLKEDTTDLSKKVGALAVR